MMDNARGVDVYAGTGSVDWPAVRSAGIDFAYIKATEGIAYARADYYAEAAARARAAALKVGAYHYFLARDSGAAQADYFLSVARPARGDLLPALDLETMDGHDAAAVLAGVAEWLQTVAGKVGRKPVIYVTASFWAALGNPDDFGDYPLWVAEYTDRPAPRIPTGWRDYAIWQHSATGRVAGIVGDADLDRLNGPVSRLDELAVP
jgi:lysozyme